MRREDKTADLSEYVEFGDVARDQCGQQCQYAARKLCGAHGAPDLGSDLRWIGDTADYHFIVIHKDDVATFVARFIEYQETGIAPDLGNENP